MGLLVLPLERQTAFRKSEDSVPRSEGCHLSIRVEEALRRVGGLTVPPQRVQLVIAKLADRFDGPQLPRRDLEDQSISFDVLNAPRRDPQSR